MAKQLTWKQMQRLVELVNAEVVTRENFQRFLENPEGNASVTAQAPVQSVSAQTFTNTVNYDDPRRRQIDKTKYYYVDPNLTPDHFPIERTGSAEVTYGYVEFDHEPTTQEVLDAIENDPRGLRRPDRAEAEDFLEAHPEERMKAPVISLCGKIVEQQGYRFMADVSADSLGVGLYWVFLHYEWNQRCRFLAVLVRKEN